MMEQIECTYLANMPQSLEEFGLCKTLLVRREVIHIKHIFTEIFVRKTIDIQKYLDVLGMSLFDYMAYMTNRLRHLHKITRKYTQYINLVVRESRERFFPLVDLLQGLNNQIILDFDGVCTKYQFQEHLYTLCHIHSQGNVSICSANPTVTEHFFINNRLLLPKNIYACRGKEKKIKALLHLNQKYDNVFYVDNEVEYLEFAWIFGIKTFHYTNKTIKDFSLNSK